MGVSFGFPAQKVCTFTLNVYSVTIHLDVTNGHRVIHFFFHKDAKPIIENAWTFSCTVQVHMTDSRAYLPRDKCLNVALISAQLEFNFIKNH